jgi:hypothetical protein
MPSHSKSQQHLFGMVHAYQKGQLKQAPAKIKEVAKHISPTSATHFAETKTEELPEHVKAACAICGCGDSHDDHKHKDHKKKVIKQAFDRGFFKAASDYQIDPLLTLDLIKLAGDGAYLAANSLGGTLSGAMGGVGGGISAGAIIGSLLKMKEETEKERTQRDYIAAILQGAPKGALIGAGIGGAVGSVAGGINGFSKGLKGL